MKRAVMGYQAGIITLNQALEIVSLPPERNANDRLEKSSKPVMGELPRTNEQNANDEKTL